MVDLERVLEEIKMADAMVSQTLNDSMNFFFKAIPQSPSIF